MTILPNKQRKMSKSAERHGVQQTSNRAPPVLIHRQQSGNNSNVENRVNGVAAGASRNGPRTRSSSISRSVTGAVTEAVKQPRRNLPRTNRSTEVYNSDDEDGSGFMDNSLEVWFEERLRLVRGFVIKQVRGDGACLFRAVADQVYGDEEMHDVVRRLCMDYMEKNSDHFAQFVTEDFRAYIARKRRRNAQGNHMELQAISEIYLRPIEIYEYCTEPRNISTRFDGPALAEPYPPIRLSYHGSVHYNSVVDPNKPTIGIGLGLPGYTCEAGNINAVQQTMEKSEVQMIEDAIVSDKIKTTDCECTEQEINKQVAQQSYLETMNSVNKGSGTDVASKEASYAFSEPGCSHTAHQSHATNFQANVSFEWFHAAASDAEEKELLAKVMALSKEEFLNSLEDKQGDEDQAGSSKSI